MNEPVKRDGPSTRKGSIMATINQIPMTIMGNLVSGLEPKRTSGGKTVVN